MTDVYLTLYCEPCEREYVGPAYTDETERLWLKNGATEFCGRQCAWDEAERQYDRDQENSDPYAYLDTRDRENRLLTDIGHVLPSYS